MSADDRDLRTARLVASAAARSAEAEAKAHRSITKLYNTGKSITFIAVARDAGVSTSFLYQNQRLRREIATRRKTATATATVVATASAATLESLRTKLATAVARNRELADQIELLRTENQTLRSRIVETRGPSATGQ